MRVIENIEKAAEHFADAAVHHRSAAGHQTDGHNGHADHHELRNAHALHGRHNADEAAKTNAIEATALHACSCT